MNNLKLIHYDDDVFEMQMFSRAFSKQDQISVISTTSHIEFKNYLSTKNFYDIAVIDVHLDSKNDEESGVDYVKFIKEKFPHTIIIMRSTDTSHQTISQCLHAGADDFLSKAVESDELYWRIQQSVNLVNLKRGVASSQTLPLGGTTGRSYADLSYVGKTSVEVNYRLQRIIPSAVTAVLITGESGTGKETVVDQLEQLLPSNIPLVRFNCATLNQNLVESELFGYAKGAFTGAVSDKLGLVEAADGGWLFLDEIATLSPSAQASLLRVIENQEIRPVGSAKTKRINVRFIGASNESLEDLVMQNKFRNDLYQRLKETSIHMSPLRERPYEIRSLVDHFCKSMHGGPYRITEPAMKILESCAWNKGNIRQLRNCLRAMTELHSNQMLTPIAIPKEILDASAVEQRDEDDSGEPSRAVSTEVISMDWQPGNGTYFSDLSDELLIQMVQRCQKVQPNLSLRSLSKMIGYPRTTLTDKLKSMIKSGRSLPQSFVTLVDRLG